MELKTQEINGKERGCVGAGGPGSGEILFRTMLFTIDFLGFRTRLVSGSYDILYAIIFCPFNSGRDSRENRLVVSSL